MRLFSSVVLAAMLSSPMLAGVNQWTSSGPDGASITQLVTDPSNAAVVYAATAGGVFKSEDAAESWRPVNEGLTSRAISALVMQPGASPTLYAGTNQGRLFKTTNGGEKWTELAQPGTAAIRGIAVEAGMLYVLTEKGFFRSEDDGETWQRPVGALNAFDLLVVLPNGTVYVGDSGPGLLYRSSNRGDSWDRVELPRCVGCFPPGIRAVAFDRVTSTLYLGDENLVYQSRDDGRSFEPLPSLSFSVTSLFGEGTGRDAVYAVLGGIHQSIYQYIGDDKTWRLAARSEQDQPIRAAARGSLYPARLYAGNSHGVMLNIEGETSWSAASRGMNVAAAHDVAVVPSQPSVVYSTTPGGLFRSNDSGKSWLAVDTTLTDATEVEVDPRSPDTVYAGNNSLLKKSRDGGATWKGIQSSGVATLAIAPSDSATIYAALTVEMSKTNNGGETWSSITSGLPMLYYYSFYGFTVSATTVDPSSSSTVYLGMWDGIYKSVDAGSKWNRVATIENAQALAVDPTDHSIVYAAAKGISKSVDEGITWQPSGLGKEVVQTLILDPAGTLYAGTASGNVYTSSNRGDKWILMSDGLHGAPLRRLTIDASGKVLYAATDGGVFEYEIVISPESP